MLYLVSGASKAGKSMIAEKILGRRQIPYFSLDWLVMGFTNGMPQYGIHDKLFPDEIAERLRSLLEAMCESMLWSEVDYVIEGEAILPGSARALLDKYPEDLKTCFMGYADVDVDEKVRDVKAHGGSKGDWLIKESDDSIRQHVVNMLTYSRKVKKECTKHDICYFDTSTDFAETVERATQYLLDWV